jgi:hypothetical protein
MFSDGFISWLTGGGTMLNPRIESPLGFMVLAAILLKVVLVLRDYWRLDMSKMKWIYGGAMVLVVILASFTCARAQTPPVSTVLSLPDTTFATEIQLDFIVESTIAWEAGGGVGIYYQLPGSESWNYAGASIESPLMWTPPFVDTTYLFTSTVSDNEGNNEGYNFTAEASTVYAPGVAPPDVPMLQWHWTHPTTGSAVMEYQAEWDVGGNIRMLMDIAVGDTTYAFVEVPYTPGQNQRIRVRGEDSAHRLGVWSEWSDYWSDVYPGQPGKPAGMLIIDP